MKKTVAFLLAILICASAFPTFSLAATKEQLTDLPTFFIQLDNGKPISSISKDYNLPAKFSMRSSDFADMDDVPIEIKGRGNSTWNLPKKPYQIKFGSKTDLLGMGKAKKWILLANYWDKTLMRNAVMYDLANKMNNIFSVEWKFVDVYVNGVYNGNYLLTEKIEFGSNRIDEDTENGAVLMELENTLRHSDCSACVETGMKVHATIKDPEVDESFSQVQMNAVKSTTLSRLNTIETALKGGYYSYSKFIDVQSFIDWYIQNELAKNFDAAFFTSCYCYLDSEGMLHMGPVWDVDVCFGNQDVQYIYQPASTDNGLNYYNYRADKGPWYVTLLNDEIFVGLLKQRWNEIKCQGLLDGMVEKVDSLKSEIAQSEKFDHQEWPDALQVTTVRDQGTGHGGTVYYTFDEEVAYYKDWLSKRINWLDGQWGLKSGRTTAMKYIDKINGGDIAGNAILSTVTDGIWNFKFNGTGEFPNRKSDDSLPFFYECLDSGMYKCKIKFKPGTNNTVHYDYFKVNLWGESKDGDEVIIDSSFATHITYSVSGKDADGYATLNYSFDTTDLGYENYFMNIESYNAVCSIKSIELYQQQQVPLGDANGDFKIDSADALLTLQFSVSLDYPDKWQKNAANVLKNGVITSSDALKILQYSINLIDSF